MFCGTWKTNPDRIQPGEFMGMSPSGFAPLSEYVTVLLKTSSGQ
jgi:hypothetical protein